MYTFPMSPFFTFHLPFSPTLSLTPMKCTNALYVERNSLGARSALSILTGLGTIPDSGNDIFCLRHRVQISSGSQLASYPMGTEGSFPEVKAVGA
jgi:hypothetical protein